jgi:hypothetical protein
VDTFGQLFRIFSSAGQTKAPPRRGFQEERMKGLEPSTFCMANRPGRFGLAQDPHR